MSFKACLSFLQAFLDQVLDSEVLVLSPSIILPRRAAHSAGPTPKMHPWRPFDASWLKKWCSKRLSKNGQIFIPFRYWILTLSALFWDAKMAPKSIQNRSKLGSRPIRVSASIFTYQRRTKPTKPATNPTKPKQMVQRNRTKPPTSRRFSNETERVPLAGL